MQELPPLWSDAPRHAPGREFPRYRFIPGVHPHPRTHPDGSLRDAGEPAPGLPPGQWRQDGTYLWGIDLYHQGFLWESHEEWEGCFHAAVDRTQKEFVQSLIQIAAATLQAHRGKGIGVRTFAQRIDMRLARVVEETAGERYMGVDVATLLADARRFFGPALGGADGVGSAHTVGLAPRIELG